MKWKINLIFCIAILLFASVYFLGMISLPLPSTKEGFNDTVIDKPSTDKNTVNSSSRKNSSYLNNEDPSVDTSNTTPPSLTDPSYNPTPATDASSNKINYDETMIDPTAVTPTPASVYPVQNTAFSNPFSSNTVINTYVPYDIDKIQYSSLTGMSNSTPVYYINDIGEGFCKFHKTNIERLEYECNKLDNDTCAATTCCLLLGGQKCVAGNENGAKMTSNYGDSSIINREYYYYMGKCYGNCKDGKYKFEAPLVPSSRCAPPGASIPEKTYTTPFMEGENVQILPLHDTQGEIQSNQPLFDSTYVTTDEDANIISKLTGETPAPIVLPEVVRGAAPDINFTEDNQI